MVIRLFCKWLISILPMAHLNFIRVFKSKMVKIIMDWISQFYIWKQGVWIDCQMFFWVECLISWSNACKSTFELLSMKKFGFILPMKFRSGWTYLGILVVQGWQGTSPPSMSPSFSEKKTSFLMSFLINHVSQERFTYEL